jgi:hypothetical protein
MHYLYAKWLHFLDNEPDDLYSEIDDERWERRKIEVCRDGFVGLADGTIQTKDTGLALVPLSRVPVAITTHEPCSA